MIAAPTGTRIPAGSKRWVVKEISGSFFMEAREYVHTDCELGGYYRPGLGVVGGPVDGAQASCWPGKAYLATIDETADPCTFRVSVHCEGGKSLVRLESFGVFRAYGFEPPIAPNS